MIYGTREFDEHIRDIIRTHKRHPTYYITCKHAVEMSVHVYGEKPIYLLDRSRPREDNEVKIYRLDNYEPTTKAGCDKALDIVSKIFNPSLSSVRWKESNKEIDELKKYTLEYFPEYNTLINWNKNVLLRKMIADPNGVVAVKVDYAPETDSELPDPKLFIYGSKNVFSFDYEHYLICANEVNESERPSEDKKYLFEYWDNIFYRKFEAWYEPETKQIRIEELINYQHNCEEIPVWKLKGKTKSLDNGDVVYESFFSSALPHWNYAVIHESDLLGAYINHLHPQKYEIAEECSYRFPFNGTDYPCNGGQIRYEAEGKHISMNCPRCGGAGITSVKSPYGVYQVSKQKLEDNSLPSGLMPMGYITIPVEATKMLEERTDKMVRKGMWAINMDIEDNVGENQSAVAKVIDRSAQYDTLYQISEVVFDGHLQNEYYFINKFKFGYKLGSANKDIDANLPEITKPVKFDIMSTSELIESFDQAKKSGLDRNFLRVKEIEILSRDLTTNPDLKNYLVQVLNLDPMPGYTLDDISLGVSKGFIRKVDAVVNANIKPFVDRAIKENSDFFNLDQLEKVAILEEYAEELIESEKPAIAPNLLDDPDRTIE